MIRGIETRAGPIYNCVTILLPGSDHCGARVLQAFNCRSASEPAGRAALTASKAEAESKANAAVMADVIELIGAERSQMATALRDQGRIEEAREAFAANSAFLGENALRYGSSKLKEYGAQQKANVDNLVGEKWIIQRKTQSEGDVYRVKQ